MPHKDLNVARDYAKQYREKNKEKIAAKRRQYREKNREKLININKQYREKNKEKIATQRKQYREKNKDRIKNYRTDPRYAFSTYRTGAKKKGLEFSICLNFFIDMIKKPCTYCGVVGAMGIDRIDSNIGYIETNCAPCCSKCNYMKLDYTFNEFKEHIKKIYNHLKDKP